MLLSDDDALSAAAAIEAATLTLESLATVAGMPGLEGRIVTVEPALIVSVFCRICVAVRLAAFVPSPTVMLPE